MSNMTQAQEEFSSFLAKNSDNEPNRSHPEDRKETSEESIHSDDEEDRHRASQIDTAMLMPSDDRGLGQIKLPPASFDCGRATGVKGVIADARSYEQAKKTKWVDRVLAARRSVFGMDVLSGAGRNRSSSRGESASGESAGEGPDEERFLQQWRESRRRELEATSRNGPIRSRRTSPSVRIFGRLDEVDAMGYLDAIEKVARETTVVVFVYDHEVCYHPAGARSDGEGRADRLMRLQSQVSTTIEHALLPIVCAYPTVHFVKVHYSDIEFDNAAVPAILSYRNQGDLFANLTGVIEMIPDHDDFDSDSLKRLFQSHGIL
jgi:hypothetical protein